MKRPIINQEERELARNSNLGMALFKFKIAWLNLERKLWKTNFFAWLLFVVKYRILKHPIVNIRMKDNQYK